MNAEPTKIRLQEGVIDRPGKHLPGRLHCFLLAYLMQLSRAKNLTVLHQLDFSQTNSVSWQLIQHDLQMLWSWYVKELEQQGIRDDYFPAHLLLYLCPQGTPCKVSLISMRQWTDHSMGETRLERGLLMMKLPFSGPFSFLLPLSSCVSKELWNYKIINSWFSVIQHTKNLRQYRILQLNIQI